MNVSNARKTMLRHVIQVEGMSGGHDRHDQQLCDYADAAAQDMYETLVKEIPSMVDTAMTKYLKDNPYSVEVDQASLANVKTQITNLFKSIFR